MNCTVPIEINAPMAVTEGKRRCGLHRLACGDLSSKETLGQRPKWSEEPGMCLKKTSQLKAAQVQRPRGETCPIWTSRKGIS